jgi:glycosyltransferase involved in cell wall biosynthesis
LKICKVVTGIIPVLPEGERGWGAVEKIIFEYKKALEYLGHTVDMKFLNEVQVGDYDIVHVHMANLAAEAMNRGIPYVFSLHDHHVEYYGKESDCFKRNLAAMKGSIFSITHAEHLLEYFNETDKLFYLTHGVSIDFFQCERRQLLKTQHRLLMVANNGLAGDYGNDRKGFRLGIEAANKLNMPITIVGAEANLEFFKIHKDLLGYSQLTTNWNNPCEYEILSYFENNTIFLHPSSLEAGHPNLTLVESAACCMPMVATYKGSRPMDGMYVLNELTVDAVVDGVKFIMEYYNQLVEKMQYSRGKYDWVVVCRKLEAAYKVVHEMGSLPSCDVAEAYFQSHTKQK